MSDSTEKAVQAPEATEEQVDNQQPEATGEADNEAMDLPAQLVAAQEKSIENYNKYMQLAADIDNLRKRTVREVEHARKYGAERLSSELLTAVDSLEMGIEAGASASTEALIEGTQATLKLLVGALMNAGIEQLDPLGEPFDPNLHEAMTMQPSDSAEPGSVLTVVQKGYRLNGRLLRPARVIVASEPGT
jgi:molecular chaperone GrpE